MHMTCLPGGAMPGSIIDGNHDVHVRVPRELAVLGVVVGALEVVDARADRDRAAEVRAVAGQAGEVRQPDQREVHLARRAAELVALDLLDEVVRQLLRARRAAGRCGAGRGPETTIGAAISSPFSSDDAASRGRSSRAPARPAHSCGSRRRARAPRRAIASLIAPVPPFWKPHARNAPSISPM